MGVDTMSQGLPVPVSVAPVSEARGFLPEEDPIDRLETGRHRPAVESYLDALESAAESLPDRLDANEIRSIDEDLPRPPDGLVDELSDRETVRVCQANAFLASAYVHEIGSEPADRLPAAIAVPLYRSSARLGRQPILAYDLLCLHNFRRLDPDDGFDLDNLDTVQEFTHLDDERWFVKIHVAIEAAAGPALVSCLDAQRGVLADDTAAVREALETIADSLTDQTEIMGRMTEGNDPTVFATDFRPYYQGFDRVVYEGVPEFGGEPQTFRGGSGAQSSIMPAIDATLGIDHAATELVAKLLDMREYMPPEDRALVDALDDGPAVCPYAADSSDPELRAAFNRCVEQLHEFRQVHLGQVIRYIREVTGETTGTGGTDYEEFLGMMTRETSEHTV